ncbi:MAG TPA: protein kinase [Bryobacteraceae bacterium]|nr:protein kinase [Bryobacteraceae bacterium]
MLQSGERLGPYQVIAPLGVGGMGEVYRARDTRLERTVALKVLPQDLSARPDVLQRFEREARAVSALNHPNICTLHDIGTESGKPFLVMEYLEGETLASRIERAPLSIADACQIAIQIGEALDQAHTRGIVHRDLKPGNIMLTGAKGGNTVKLLDFGLARMVQTPISAGSQTSLPTVAQDLTQEGSIVGTFQYMAPEQLEGAEADHRADIFAFGAVLFEMLAGRRAFDGKSQAMLISAIMSTDPPPVSSVQPLAPPALDRLVRKCLAKDPGQRWQSVRDLVSEIRWISESGSQAAAAPSSARPRRRQLSVAWIAAAVFASAFVGLLGFHLRESPKEERMARFLAPLPEQTIFRYVFDSPSVSPDGTKLVFAAETSQGTALYLRSLDSTVPRVLLKSNQPIYSPFWSPDGRYVAATIEGRLRKLDIAGGLQTAICDPPTGPGGTWSRDGVILYPAGVSGPILRVNAAGGTPTPVTRLDALRGEIGHMFPVFLPDGNHFLFTITATRPDVRGVYAGSLDSPKTFRILEDETNVQYDDGMLLFIRSNTVVAQPFDAGRLRVTGEAVPLVEQAYLYGGAIPGGPFSARTGTLALRTGEGIAPTRLAWYDRNGNRSALLGDPADFTNPCLSPDGRTLAVCIRDPVAKTRDIWLWDLVRGTRSRLTFDPAEDFNPAWSPDGRQIAFTSTRRGPRDIFLKAASGTGSDEFLLTLGIESNIEDWTRDGKYLIFNSTSQGASRGVYGLPLSGERKPFPVLQSSFVQDMAQVSPNGKWIVYHSVESGKDEIYVQSFPPTGGKWQISNATGREPQWSRDGKELYYIEGTTRLMAVSVQAAGDRLEAGIPKMLFEAPFVSTGRNAFVVTSDGRFLAIVRNEAGNTLPMTVVLNWRAGLKR